ncbi:hypothetical protein [Rouxiella sp. Mn2063]|uniref:hypothetical protein n=1 Tax=Rouxiella sp. Mn2063 TaxID=3395262 RepID=UPI003BE9AF9E
MAINLTCYSKICVSDLQDKIDALTKKHSEIFPDHYVLYKVRKPDEIQKEISNEFGLDPSSFFRIALVDKSLQVSTLNVADMLREELGKDSIIVLFEGESLI